METIYLAGGCFWGLEKYFDQFNGVKCLVGYANSNCENPSYQYVCTGMSQAAETVKIDYDPDKISLQQILYAFFLVVDPLSINKQGNDVGSQYRSGIYYSKDDQKRIVDGMITYLNSRLNQKSAIEVKKIENFYPAEDYHQKYLVKNPHGYCHIPLKNMRDIVLPETIKLDEAIMQAEALQRL